MSLVKFGNCSGFFSGVGRVGLVVIQEWWGLNEHIKNLTKKYSSEGIMALAPDLYHGKVATTTDEASHLMNDMDWDVAIDDIKGAVGYLREKGAEKVVVMGFCMGGALTIASACRVPKIDAGICFYGIPPKNVADPSNVKCPLQLHFGEKDCSVGFSDPTAAANLERTLKEHNKQFTFYRYDADHAFMNETRPEVFDKKSSVIAFQRSVDFIKSL